MDKTAIFPVVAAALTDGEGRVLLQRRPPGKTLAGLWEFPGGKIERDETPEAALVRELTEELGIVVALHDLAPIGFASEPLADRHLILLLYAVAAWTGTPSALEATALSWVMPRDMASLDMPPADRPLVAALMRLNHKSGFAT